MRGVKRDPASPDKRVGRAVGKVFGKVTVLAVINAKNGTWSVRCECGHVFNARRQSVFRGEVRCIVCRPGNPSMKDFSMDSMYLRHEDIQSLARMARKGSDSALIAIVRRVLNP